MFLLTMLDHIHLENLLFIDVETVPGYPDFASVPDSLKELYLKKSERLKQEKETIEEQYFNHAGIYAEFGKVVCISLGIFKKESSEYQFRLKSIFGDDEHELLQRFSGLMNHFYPRVGRNQFCGHNIREFDIPFICRRFLVHQLKLPVMFDISGFKPWDFPMVDTLHQWRFGDYKHYTSLKLLALILGIDSPKDDIEGKDVGRVYWQDKNLERIVNYCQRDVITVAQLILRFKGLSLLQQEQIIVSS